MEIEHVYVSGFKAIDEIEFEPGQLTVVTGPNNSGKTSAVEAIRLALDPQSITEFENQAPKLIRAGHDAAECRLRVRDDSSETTQRRVELRQPPPEQAVDELIRLLSDAESGIPMHASQKLFDMENDTARRELSESLRAVLIQNRDELVEEAASRVLTVQVGETDYHYAGSPNLPVILPEEVGSRVEELLSEYTETLLGASGETVIADNISNLRLLSPTHIKSSGFPSATNDTILVSRPEQLKSNVSDDTDDTAVRLSHVRELLNETQPGDEIDTLSFDEVVFDGEDGKYQVPFEFTGDGFQAMVRFLWSLYDDGELPGVVMLEEPESHMHPEYVRQLVQQLTSFVRNENVQLFTTTHDIDLIRSFFDAVPPEQQEFLQERFKLLQMDTELPRVHDYEEAAEIAMEMQIDLRGR